MEAKGPILSGDQLGLACDTVGARLGEALDALEDRFRVQMGLGDDVVFQAAGQPLVIPVAFFVTI